MPRSPKPPLPYLRCRPANVRVTIPLCPLCDNEFVADHPDPHAIERRPIYWPEPCAHCGKAPARCCITVTGTLWPRQETNAPGVFLGVLIRPAET